jgi:hypothetical protein
MKKLVILVILLASMIVSMVVIVKALAKPKFMPSESREVGVTRPQQRGVPAFARRAAAPQNIPQLTVGDPASRVRAEMRVMAVALEAYYIDYDRYPAWEMSNLYQPPQPILMNPSLTTPIAYLSAMFQDQFARSNAGGFTYYAHKDGWIITSPGPDEDYDIVPQQEYDGSITQPSPQLLLKAYDVTNGTISNGDIFRVKQ